MKRRPIRVVTLQPQDDVGHAMEAHLGCREMLAECGMDEQHEQRVQIPEDPAAAVTFTSAATAFAGATGRTILIADAANGATPLRSIILTDR